jgi:hypothetical protein
MLQTCNLKANSSPHSGVDWLYPRLLLLEMTSLTGCAHIKNFPGNGSLCLYFRPSESSTRQIQGKNQTTPDMCDSEYKDIFLFSLRPKEA